MYYFMLLEKYNKGKLCLVQLLRYKLLLLLGIIALPHRQFIGATMLRVPTTDISQQLTHNYLSGRLPGISLYSCCCFVNAMYNTYIYIEIVQTLSLILSTFHRTIISAHKVQYGVLTNYTRTLIAYQLIAPVFLICCKVLQNLSDYINSHLPD